MDLRIVLQTVGIGYDFNTLPGTIILIVISAVFVALAFLGIYWAYTTIGLAVNSKQAADEAAMRAAAVAQVQGIIATAKADLLSDFSDLVDMDKQMREKLTLASIEEKALAKASTTS